MSKMAFSVEQVVNAYKSLSRIPSVLGGKVTNNGKKITSKWAVRNLDKGKNSKYLYNYVLDDDLRVIGESDFGTDASNELLSAISPKETFKAVIRDEKDNKDVKKQFLEVWQANKLAHSVDLTALDIHGEVYTDSEFGSLDWTQDETAIVYIAEKKLTKYEPYIKRKAPEDPSKSNGSGENLPSQGQEHVYRQDWGEQLTGKHLSVIVVCCLTTESFTILEGLPDCWCPGQVRFAPDGRGVVGVAWETEPRRLGLIFCTNRPSYIFSLTFDGTLKKLSAEGAAVRSPCFGLAGEVLWLQRPAGGPHHGCHALVMKRPDSDEVSTLIDIVQIEKKIADEQSFYGIYSLSLPGRCLSADGRRLVFSTPQQYEVRSYVLDIDSGRIVDISNKCWPGSTTVLDIHYDIILASFSNMATPPQLHVARLPPQGQENNIVWVPVSHPVEIPTLLRRASVAPLHLNHDSQDDVKSFTAIYFAPESKEKLPLILWPHGGPHSGFVNSFSFETAFYCMLGCASLHVNYRGSTGAGQASVQFLPKRVGDADVKDCKYATDEALKAFAALDSTKICLLGGSHGGFLVTHLSGQYPEIYKSVVTRNPVIDVSSMFNSTDIADWCAVEAGYEYTERGPVSEEQLVNMRRCSPLAHVHKVRAPTALMLGAVDKRVPRYQGLEYARRLKANGVPVKIYMYEDNHSLASQSVEMDSLINSAIWFLEHM